MQKHRKFIGDKRFYLMVLGVAMPIMIQNGITNFVSLLDNIMVGRHHLLKNNFLTGALYWFGGDTTKDFSFALLVGFFSGCYSSIFVASPLWVTRVRRPKPSTSPNQSMVASRSVTDNVT